MITTESEHTIKLSEIDPVLAGKVKAAQLNNSPLTIDQINEQLPDSYYVNEWAATSINQNKTVYELVDDADEFFAVEFNTIDELTRYLKQNGFKLRD